MILPLVGQRVEVMLIEGEANIWYPGTGRVSGVQLDQAPPGSTTWVVERDISEWRPAGSRIDGAPAAGLANTAS